MNSKITNRTSQESADQKLIDGFTKHNATLATLVIGGTSYKTTDVITIVQGLVNSAKAVVSTRATWQTAVAADKAERAKQKTFMSGVRQSLLVAYGGSLDVLADFGLAPHKARTAPTPEQKQAAAAKAKATRAARHTMSSKQKKAVKGDVTGITVTVNSASGASQPSGDVTKVPTPAAPVGPVSTAPAAAPASTTPHTGS
jgi:hypothetical protein